MPFFSGIDIGGNIDVSGLGLEVSSVVDAAGTEYLANFTNLEASFAVDFGAPINGVNEWAEVGSFAGDPAWYDAYNDAFKGENLVVTDAEIFDAAVEAERLEALGRLASSEDLTSLDILRELPFADQVKAIGSQIVTDFKIFAQDAAAAVQQISKFSPIINAVSSAFGITSPIAQIIQPIVQAAGVASAVPSLATPGFAPPGTAQATITDPRVLATLFSVVGAAVPGSGQAIRAGVSAYNLAQAVGSLLPSTSTPRAQTYYENDGTASSTVSLTSTPNTVTTGGTLYTPAIVDSNATFRELTVAETAQLERFIDPIYRSNITLPVDPAKLETYTQALQTVESTTKALKEYDAYKAETTNEILNTADVIDIIGRKLEDKNTNAEERKILEEQLTSEYDRLAIAQSALAQTNTAIDLVTDARNQATNIILSTNASTVNSAAPVGGTVDQYTMVKNANGTYSIFDRTTSTTVQSGLTEQAAILQIQDLGIATPGITAKTADPVAISGGDLGEIVITASRIPGPESGITVAETNQARAQQTVRELRNNRAQSGDWRVRLRLAPNSNYLYNAPSPGILSALKSTDGVIFPYTPSIETAYKANYDPYELTHSNYRGYFYKGSYVDAVNVRGTFTAQDSKEADYLLAVIHFFRSCTKMFYGSNDQQRGAPPPLVYLNGYGEYQFSEHPCVVSQFNYTLPPDVDYIRSQNTLTNNTNLLNSRLRNSIANNPLAYSVNRLLNSRLTQGALDFRPTQVGTGNLGDSSPTYVPTKMEISITLLPIQSRSQISNNFSVKEFANGNLLKGGYW